MKTAVKTKCSFCDKPFERTRTRFGTLNYCSWNCYQQSRRSNTNSISVKCGICGKVFSVCPARLKENRGKYCSRLCFYNAIKGRESRNKNKTYEELLGITRALLVKKEIARKTRAIWTESAYVEKQMKARRTRPNHQEEFMAKCFPFLEYVGDGKLVIGGKCPDFKVNGQHKLVEFLGIIGMMHLKKFNGSHILRDWGGIAW